MVISSQLIIGAFVALAGLVYKCEGQTCPPLTFANNNLCYGVLQYPVQFPKAQFACNVAGGVLATVKDQASLDFQSQIVQFMLSSQYWLGLRQNTTTTTDTNNVAATWNGSWVYDSTEAAPNNTFWGPNQPTMVYKGQGICATASLLNRNLWSSANCSATFGYVCQVPSSSGGSSCFKVVNTPATFLDARAACKALNGILAEPQTTADMISIANQINSLYTKVTSPPSTPTYAGQVGPSAVGAWVLVPEVSNPLMSQTSLPWQNGYGTRGLPSCGGCAYLASKGLTADASCTMYYNSQGNNYGTNYYGLSQYPMCVYPTMSTSAACSS
jgi:hypothetical protein